MGAVGILAASDIRRHWRGAVALALMVGVVGAVVLAAGAGARRSESALARFDAWSRASDVELNIAPASEAQLRAFTHSPGVAAVAALNAYALTIGGRPNLAIAAAVDGNFGNVVDRGRIIAGRRVNPAAYDEITIGESLANQLHVRLGGHLDADSITPAQFQKAIRGGDSGPPAGPHLRLRIVGIVRRPLDLGDRATVGGVVVLTPAFDRKYAHQIQLWDEVLRVRTEHGAADVPRVTETARRMFGDPENFSVLGLSIETQGAGDAIDVLARALWIFAAVVALAGIVVIGIVLGREFSSMSVDQHTLRSLGLNRRRRIAVAAPRALLILFGGAFVAALGAVLLSPLFPLGLARRADPDPGLHADRLVLVIGVAAIAGVVLLFSLVAAAQATRVSALRRTPAARRRGPTIVERIAGSGLPPTLSNGLRMAAQPGTGDTAVPVRSAFVGAAFGVFGVIGVLVFAASLSHLAATPRLYGWTFDFRVGDNSSYAKLHTCPRTDFGVTRVPGVAEVAAVCSEPVQVDGRPVTGLGFTQMRGSIEPEVVAGRAPSTDTEVALGQKTLQALGKHIGDTVQVHGGNVTSDFTIVGQVAFAGIDDEAAQPLADGAAFADGGFARVYDSNNVARFVIGRFAPGADRAAVVGQLSAIKFGPENFGIHNRPPDIRLTVPAEIKHLNQIDWFLPALAGLLAVLALLAVGHALVTAVRRRRRELAVLKTLGFDRRQVRATVAWQATTLATIGLLVGLPVGVLVGSSAWRIVADGLGVTTTAEIPVIAIAIAIPCALAAVNLIGWLPARVAARTRPALALAAE